MRTVVQNSISNNKPIPFVWVFGGYKLFSLSVAPEADWAELFSLLYFAEWLLPIAYVYKPGVIFDFYSDDIIVPQMNNIDPKDTADYISSFNTLLSFIKKYLPSNFTFSLNRVIDQYENPEQFQVELKSNIKSLENKYLDADFLLTEAQKAMIKLNVKLLPNQDKDPKWMEKIQLVHDAYAMSSKRRPYYKSGDKIPVLNSSVKGFLPVGTTKSSIVKFWVGVGVLEKNTESYREKILSPKQLQETKTKPYPAEIPGLDGNNFKTIGVIECA